MNRNIKANLFFFCGLEQGKITRIRQLLLLEIFCRGDRRIRLTSNSNLKGELNGNQV